MQTYMSQGAVGSANIGLPGVAVKSAKWSKHRARLLKIFVAMLCFTPDVVGLLLCEVGAVDDKYDDEAKRRFEDLLREAFRISAMRSRGATEHTPGGAPEHAHPRIIWSTGAAAETLMAWKPSVIVAMLPQITHIPGQDAWRTVEVAKVSGVSRHGERVSLLVFNTHQPSSGNHPFKMPRKIAFCTSVLQHACRLHSEHPDLVGFVFAGDANCMRAAWMTALTEEPAHRLHFDAPYYIYASTKIANTPALAKAGDLALVMGAKGFEGWQYDGNIPSREGAHDCVLVGWRWCGVLEREAKVLPARLANNEMMVAASGASEHRESDSGASGSACRSVSAVPACLANNEMMVVASGAAEHRESDSGASKTAKAHFENEFEREENNVDWEGGAAARSSSSEDDVDDTNTAQGEYGAAADTSAQAEENQAASQIWDSARLLMAMAQLLPRGSRHCLDETMPRLGHL